jgi:hypothetical protein
MSMKLLLEVEPEMPLPRLFPHTDGKGFLRFMFGLANEPLEDGLGVNLSPFYCIAGCIDEDAIRADWGGESDSMIASARAQEEHAWQSPGRFIAALEQLAERLEQSGQGLPPEVYAAVDPTGHYAAYFQRGDFYKDVVGCLVALRTVAERGAARVRFFAY